MNPNLNEDEDNEINNQFQNNLGKIIKNIYNI